MTRTIAAFVFALFLAAPLAVGEGPVPFEEVPTVSLRDAVKAGDLYAIGDEPRSYKEVSLMVVNRTSRRLAVDLCGSYLHPRKRGSCQRLGLGPPIEPKKTKRRGPGTVVLHLEPGGRETLRLNTVCLDAGVGAPAQHVFDVAPKELPEVRETVLRWWVENPDAPQNAVNTAIWHFRDKVELRPGTASNYRRPQGSFASVHGGTYYRLKDGEAISDDAEGVTRILGAEIFALLPTKGALFAIGLGTNRGPELWRLALTGREPWGKVMSLDPRVRILDVLSVDDGGLLLVTDQGVLLRRSSGGTVSPLDDTQVLDVSARVEAKGRATVVLKVPSSEGFYQKGERRAETSDIIEVWTVDTGTGAAERQKRFWNVSAAMIGPAGFYGLSHKGVLRKFVARNFKDLDAGEPFARILGIGKKLVWVADHAGKAVAVEARTGKIRFRTDIEVGAFAIDEVTDDLAFVSDGRFFRVRAADGEREEIGGN